MSASPTDDTDLAVRLSEPHKRSQLPLTPGVYEGVIERLGLVHQQMQASLDELKARIDALAVERDDAIDLAADATREVGRLRAQLADAHARLAEAGLEISE